MSPTSRDRARQRIAHLVGAASFAGETIDAWGLRTGSVDPERLLERAMRQTGLSDFWDERFRQPFQLLASSITKQHGFSYVGRLMGKRQLGASLANRLLIARALQEHPDARSIAIHKPIFIVSLPRTGTTLLHHLLALDTNARPLLGWEARWPVSASLRGHASADSHVRRLRRRFKVIYAVAPSLKRMHVVHADGPNECIPLIRNTFSAPAPFRGPYQEWYLAQPPQERIAAYSEYRQQLQLIQLRRPQPGHWLLKSPIHLFAVDALIELFPDASIVMIHRNPLHSVASLCSLLDFLLGVAFEERWRRDLLPQDLLRWAAEGLSRAEAARQNAPAGRIHDIDYRDLVADPAGTIRKLYQAAGYPFHEHFEQAIHLWLEQNPQHKHGKHRYALEDYGLAPAVVDETFAWYRERYGIA